MKIRAGFTIVELLIVVAVIGALATISVVAYNGIQARARDASLRNVADKVADALQLFAAKNDRWPYGGSSATTAIGSATECPGAAQSNGWFLAGAGYTCTVSESLVASGYLPANFAQSLPGNKYFAGSNRSMMFYRNSPVVESNLTVYRGMLYYTMESPSASDTANFNAELTKCGYNPAGTIQPRDSWGMRNGICVEYTL